MPSHNIGINKQFILINNSAGGDSFIRKYLKRVWIELSKFFLYSEGNARLANTSQDLFRLLKIQFLISIILGMAFYSWIKIILVIERANI